MEGTEEFHQYQIQIKPTDPSVHHNYGQFLQDVGRFQDAEQRYQRALELNPQLGASLGNYAVLLWQQQKAPEKAKDLFESALVAEPGLWVNVVRYASFLYEQTGFHEAAELFVDALKRAPSEPLLLQGYADLLFSAERYKESFEVAERYLALRPEDIERTERSAQAMTLGGGSRLRAIELYGRVLDTEPGRVVSAVNLAQLLFLEHRDAEANELLESFLDGNSHPDSRLEAWFYKFAHVEKEGHQSLVRIRALIDAGVRSQGWDLSPNVDRCRNEHHPHLHLLSVLALVAVGAESADGLTCDPNWQRAQRW
jgi:tetratricopeptide (TPR) repeat protein